MYEQFPDRGTLTSLPTITNAQQQGCDVFFSPVSPWRPLRQIIKQARDPEPWACPFMAGDTWDSNVVLEAAKGTSLNICVTTFFRRA